MDLNERFGALDLVVLVASIAAGGKLHCTDRSPSVRPSVNLLRLLFLMRFTF